MDIHLAQSAVSFLTFFYLSYMDVKYKEIPLTVIVFYAGIGFATNIFLKTDVSYVLLSSVPGLFLLILSFVTDEMIGSGDGLTILALGIWMGLRLTLTTLFLGIAFVCFFSFLTIAFNKVLGKRMEPNYQIPLIPFIFSGLVVSVYG